MKYIFFFFSFPSDYQLLEGRNLVLSTELHASVWAPSVPLLLSILTGKGHKDKEQRSEVQTFIYFLILPSLNYALNNEYSESLHITSYFKFSFNPLHTCSRNCYLHTCSRNHIMVSVQSPSHVQLFVTPWTAACQASLSSILPMSINICMAIFFKIKIKDFAGGPVIKNLAGSAGDTNSIPGLKDAQRQLSPCTLEPVPPNKGVAPAHHN